LTHIARYDFRRLERTRNHAFTVHFETLVQQKPRAQRRGTRKEPALVLGHTANLGGTVVFAGALRYFASLDGEFRLSAMWAEGSLSLDQN
jgi:hypothetical protein